MSLDPRATLTPAQRIIFDKFTADPTSAVAAEISPPVLRALEQAYRPATDPAAQHRDLLQKRAGASGDLLSAADAAQLLKISLNTFGRSVERVVGSTVVDGRVMFHRADLLKWGEQRFANRKRPPARFR